MKNNNGAPVDFISPFVELLQDLIHFLIKAFSKLIGSLFKNNSQKITFEDLNNKKKTCNEDKLGFSANRNKELPLNEIDFTKHSFIVGAAGFGKTNLMHQLIDNAVKNGMPVIFLDPKGDREAEVEFIKICEKNKRNYLIFMPSKDSVVKINPWGMGSVNQVVDRIMRAYEWSEPFYRDECQRALLYVLRELHLEGAPFTLSNIVRGLHLYKESKNISSILTKLMSLESSDFFGWLSTDSQGLSTDDIRGENLCVYFGLSTQGYGETAKSLGKMLIGDLLYHSFKVLQHNDSSHTAIKKPIGIFFDEFGSLVMDDFIELQNKCRGAGIQLTLATQSTADIDKFNPELTKQIIENCANLFILKQRVEGPANFLSQSIGTFITSKLTVQTDEELSTGRGTIRDVNELIVHPNIIKQLSIGQCILVQHNPSRVDLINLRQVKL